jgi:hypothetical protein
MKTCRLQVGCVKDQKLIVRNICLSDERNNVEIINAWDDDNEENGIPSTLKDVSMIFWSMVGQGVTWQLANELSDRLEINDPRKVSKILFDIFKEYSELSEDEACSRQENSPKLCDVDP